MGKTHIMKVAYAACRASKHDVSFPQKTVMLFRPDQSSIGRLVNRNKTVSNTARVSIESDTSYLDIIAAAKIDISRGVKNATDVSWLAGPLAELKERLLKMRKIWHAEIAVLNEELAVEYKLIEADLK